MTYILDKDLKPHNTRRKEIQNVQKGYHNIFDDGIIDIYKEYINLKPESNLNESEILRKFKVISQIDYYCMVNLKMSTGSELIDCWYLSDVLKNDFDKYLKCNIFEVKEVLYNPLNGFLMYNILDPMDVARNGKEYYDMTDNTYSIGLKYNSTTDGEVYSVHGCILVSVEINKKLMHILIIYVENGRHKYNVPQYMIVDDDKYKKHIELMKKSENQSFSDINHLKCLSV